MRVGLYRHFKGKLYEVLGVVTHSETGEDMVLYRRFSDGCVKTFVRPARMWSENVKNCVGAMVPRFDVIEDWEGVKKTAEIRACECVSCAEARVVSNVYHSLSVDEKRMLALVGVDETNFVEFNAIAAKNKAVATFADNFKK
jgi:hypothetical protein